MRQISTRKSIPGNCIYNPLPSLQCKALIFRRRHLWSHRPNPYGARSVIPNQAGTCPAKSVFTLVPINARQPLLAIPSILSSSTKKYLFFIIGIYKLTHNVFRPAIRGWVAHDPPRTILCFPSKKSAVPTHTALALERAGKGGGCGALRGVADRPV